MPDVERLSDQLEGWLRSEQPKTIGSLIDVFQEKSFAVLFVLLLAVPALPLPTGGVTHVFEVIAMLLALELIVGRRRVWLPERWRAKEIGMPMRDRFANTLLPRIRWIEGHSHAHLVLVVTAFAAPPFTGLDTLPSIGVVLISLGVLLEDPILGGIGFVIGAAGVLVAFLLGRAAVDAVRGLF